MARTKVEKRITELKKQPGALTANGTVARRTKNWRRTRGAFTADPVMQQVFAEGRKIRAAENQAAESNGKKRRARS